MRIQLNGESRDLERPLSIAELLDQLGIDGRTVAVEHNRLVVRRAKYAETMVQEGSEVEIVAFVGGGHVEPLRGPEGHARRAAEDAEAMQRLS